MNFQKGPSHWVWGGESPPPKLNQYVKLVHNVGKKDPTRLEEKNTKTEKKVT